MKVWITKYALTKGILEFDAESCAPQSPNMVRVVKPGCLAAYFFGEGNQWHRTKLEAKEKARAMVAAKIARLDKQRSKLLRLTFE